MAAFHGWSYTSPKTSILVTGIFSFCQVCIFIIQWHKDQILSTANSSDKTAYTGERIGWSRDAAQVLILSGFTGLFFK